jgi:hypothetical protein
MSRLCVYNLFEAQGVHATVPVWRLSAHCWILLRFTAIWNIWVCLQRLLYGPGSGCGFYVGYPASVRNSRSACDTLEKTLRFDYFLNNLDYLNRLNGLRLTCRQFSTNIDVEVNYAI